MAVKVGLHIHASILSHRGLDQLWKIEEQWENSAVMDVDLTVDSDEGAMGVLDHITAQYNALSWLCSSPVTTTRYALKHLRHAIYRA